MSTVGLTEHQKNHTAVDALKLQCHCYLWSIVLDRFLPGIPKILLYRLSENVTHNYKQVSYDIMTPEYQF